MHGSNRLFFWYARSVLAQQRAFQTCGGVVGFRLRSIDGSGIALQRCQFLKDICRCPALRLHLGPIAKCCVQAIIIISMCMSPSQLDLDTITGTVQSPLGKGPDITALFRSAVCQVMLPRLVAPFKRGSMFPITFMVLQMLSGEKCG